MRQCRMAPLSARAQRWCSTHSTLCRSSTVRLQTAAICRQYGAHQKCSTMPTSYRRPSSARRDRGCRTPRSDRPAEGPAAPPDCALRACPRRGRAADSRGRSIEHDHAAPVPAGSRTGGIGPRRAGGRPSSPCRTAAPDSAAAKRCAALRRPPADTAFPAPAASSARVADSVGQSASAPPCRPRKSARAVRSQENTQARASDRARRSATHSGCDAAADIAPASSSTVSA